MQPEMRSNAKLLGTALGVALVLVGMSISTMLSLSRERDRAAQLAAGNQELRTSLTQIQSQMRAMTERLNALRPTQALAVAPPEPEPVVVSRPAPAKPAKKRVVAENKHADDPRWNQIQTKLEDQEKQIAGAREQIAGTKEQLDKTREDLDSKLGSTRDELNGSIAKTHDEVVALQKLGQRNYFEFQLDKSKQFQRVGPISLSLRKADLKKKSYDLMMMVDDQQLQKKNVNLYEPLRVNPAERGQPIELVVIGIHKDQIKGYISEPKYKLSELAQR